MSLKLHRLTRNACFAFATSLLAFSASLAYAGPFLLQPGSSTAASTDLTLHDPSIPEPPGQQTVTYSHDDIGSDANSTRSSSLGPSSNGGASGAASSTVTSSFSDTLISIIGSGSSTASASGSLVDANNLAAISGMTKFKVDTAGTYRIYGSFLGQADGGAASSATANLSLNTSTPYTQSLLDLPGGGGSTLNFDDLVTFNTIDVYELSYSAAAHPISLNGFGASSASFSFEAYLELQPAAVPEPSSFALVAGLVGGAWWKRRRKPTRA